jgi:hypothetical protein
MRGHRYSPPLNSGPKESLVEPREREEQAELRMTGTDLLRASRDGDQFHYHWAARESLKLLMPGTDLTAIAIEGVSDQDTEGDDGEDVIDIAEYYGSNALRNAERVVYRQLKHSTAHANDEWTVGGLRKTVEGFAQKYRQIKAEQPGAEAKVSFVFVSNRPIRESVTETIKELAAQGATPTYAHDDRYLRQYAGFDDADAQAGFFAAFSVDTAAPGLLSLEGLFRLDLTGFLPGAVGVESLLLKEMVARRASSLESDRVVVRSTVLTALGVPPGDLLPAPSLIASVPHVVATQQTRRVVEQIAGAASGPVIVHAAGGVGKSVFATQIEQQLPAGSLALVYDCFGNGGYRAPSTPRHQHHQALVQLANEMAVRGLCDPLIPVPTAQPSDYSRAFLSRISAAARALSASSPDALLAVVIDAADNAVMHANDAGEAAFAPGLLRESLPGNVRLVALCRTERIELLNPPPGALRTKLRGFDAEETKQHLRSVYGAISDQQALEFHHLTAGNPRVQAMVLAPPRDLDACLASLGQALQHDGAVLDTLLHQRVAMCRDAHLGAASEIDQLCEAIAALRPRIPIAVLSELCAVPSTLVESFAADLGHGLLADGATVQFLDEPTETWFRANFRPEGDKLDRFIERLLPLAQTSPYVAASLPQLLWEAERVDQLVDLALNDRGLPREGDLERREIAQQRAQYALKATLRAARDFEAARLALKAGGLAAGHTRRRDLLCCNTDLAGQFLHARTIEDLVATRALAGNWPGSNLHYEGAVLSAAAGQNGIARSRLRSASEWLSAWSQQPHEDLETRGVQAADIAEVGFGLLNTDGAEACARHLNSWRPALVGYHAGLIIATRLADAGRFDDLEQLGTSAGEGKHLQFAVAAAAWHANFTCSPALAQSLVDMLRRQSERISFTEGGFASRENDEVAAVGWIVAMGLRHGLLAADEAERMLLLALPTSLGRGAGSRLSTGETTLLLCGFALLARVRAQAFDPGAVAGFDIAAARQHPYAPSRDLTEHEKIVTPLSRWAALWIDCLAGTTTDIDARFRELASADLRSYSDYETPYVLIRGIAGLSPRILSFDSSPESLQALSGWYAATGQRIPAEVLTDAARAASGAPALAQITLELAQHVSTWLSSAKESAEYKSEQLVRLARAVYRFDPADARGYFDDAIEIADGVGENAQAVWQALLTLSHAACDGAQADAPRAYRIAQLAEGLAPYMGDAASEPHVLMALAALSPTTATAIASRWRDRQFCSISTYIDALSINDSSPLNTSPLTPLVLAPFTGMGEGVLDHLARAWRYAPENGAALARVIGELIHHTRFSAEAFDRLDQTARELRIDLSGTWLAPGERNIAQPKPAFQARPSVYDEPDDARRARAERARQLETELAGCDYSTVSGWTKARALVDSSRHGLRRGQAVEYACRTPPPKLGEMISTFQDIATYTAYDHAAMIENLAKLPLMPRSVREQTQRLARTVTSRFCRELTTKRYDIIDVHALARLAGDADADLLGQALTELGSQPVALDSEECYALAGRLAQRLPTDQAQVVLDDLTSMLAEIAPTDSGDGEFEHQPPVPARIAECLAGYLWAALGDPDIKTRWQAAHSVRILAGLGQDEELTALVRFALGSLDTAPFVDARLHFYDLHALQWLLYAIARCAQNPATHEHLAAFAPLLTRVLFEDVPHVVHQDSARTALLALAASGTVHLTPEQLAACRLVNAPQIAEPHASSGDAGTDLVTTESAAEHENPEAEGIHFFLDFSAYWCHPVAEAFGLPEKTIEHLAAQVTGERWGRARDGETTQDMRHALRLYGAEGTHTYKSSWPTADDLDFYRAVHSLWSVAGQMVRTRPARVDPYSEADDLFSSWLRAFLISREDGRWLADRRDPSPTGAFTDDAHSPGPEWVGELNAADLTGRLLAHGGWITVWEDSYDTTHDATQRVYVRSVLVDPGKARALVLALQTAPANAIFRLSGEDDSEQAGSHSAFELTRWVEIGDGRDGADRHDPLASGVQYPPAVPGDAVVALLGLTPDADMREWKRAEETLGRTTVWNDTHRDRWSRDLGYHGERLEIRRDALTEMLTAAGRCLIVEVLMERNCDDQTTSTPTGDGEGDDDTSSRSAESRKVYLFDAAGGCSVL